MTPSPGHSRAGPRVVVLALGNEWRGDDAAGPAVAARLADRLPADVAVRTLSGELFELLEALGEAPLVVAVDAARSGAPPGTLHRYDLADGPLPASFTGSSTHGLGLGEALALAVHLGRPLPRVVVLAIEGGSFELGQTLTPEVERACDEAVERILAEVGEIGEIGDS